MTLSQVKELVKAGNALEVKVTPDKFEGETVVNIRDYQFKNPVEAQLFLQHIALTEIPENFEMRIG